MAKVVIENTKKTIKSRDTQKVIKLVERYINSVTFFKRSRESFKLIPIRGIRGSAHTKGVTVGLYDEHHIFFEVQPGDNGSRMIWKLVVPSTRGDTTMAEIHAALRDIDSSVGQLEHTKKVQVKKIPENFSVPQDTSMQQAKELSHIQKKSVKKYKEDRGSCQGIPLRMMQGLNIGITVVDGIACSADILQEHVDIIAKKFAKDYKTLMQKYDRKITLICFKVGAACKRKGFYDLKRLDQGGDKDRIEFRLCAKKGEVGYHYKMMLPDGGCEKVEEKPRTSVRKVVCKSAEAKTSGGASACSKSTTDSITDVARGIERLQDLVQELRKEINELDERMTSLQRQKTSKVVQMDTYLKNIRRLKDTKKILDSIPSV